MMESRRAGMWSDGGLTLDCREPDLEEGVSCRVQIDIRVGVGSVMRRRCRRDGISVFNRRK